MASASKQPLPKCILCHTSEDNPSYYGKFLISEELSAHEYCLFFASGLGQNGGENDGLNGYLFEEIRKEARRGAKLRCKYCKQTGATIGCCKNSCKISVHFPCGLKNRFQNLFYRSFKSYCEHHRKIQRPPKIPSGRDFLCLICRDKFKYDKFEHAYCPDCHRFFHRVCLQENALAAGYFFSCPNCRNKREFRKEMRSIGINVVRKDASWVSDTDAQLASRRTPQCDMEVCQCPYGRKHDQPHDPFNPTPWELLLCDACNSNGTHAECAGMTHADDDQCENWVCHVCVKVYRKNKDDEPSLNTATNSNNTNNNQSGPPSVASSESDKHEEDIKASKGSSLGKRMVNSKLLYEKTRQKVRIIEVPDEEDKEIEIIPIAYVINNRRN